MSGIYIPGMEMPKGCATCPYCDRAWNKPKCKAKSTQGRFMEQKLNLDRTRQKWCPLVPVPPHGRLIDEDALDDMLADQSEDEYNRTHAPRSWERALSVMRDYLKGAPTIISADKEEPE